MHVILSTPPFSSLLRIGGGMSQNNRDRAVREERKSVFAFRRRKKEEEENAHLHFSKKKKKKNLSTFLTFQAAALSDFLMPMLEYDPDRRATAAESLRHPWLQGPPPAGYGGSGSGEANANRKAAAADENDGDGDGDNTGGRNASHSPKRSRSASPPPPSLQQRCASSENVSSMK